MDDPVHFLGKSKNRTLCSMAHLWILKLGFNMLCEIRPLIGWLLWNLHVDNKVWASSLVSCARESSYLSWCIPSKFRKHQLCNRQTSSEFVKFLICFHNFLLLFLSASVDDDFLMCKRSMCVNRFIVIAQALDKFPPFLCWPQKLHVSGTHITRMRTAYYFL